MKNCVLVICALISANAGAITATKAYVDGATNATLVASKEYTDQAIAAGSVSPHVVTNISEGVVREAVRTNYLCTVAAAQALDTAMSDNIMTSVGNNFLPMTFASMVYTKTESNAAFYPLASGTTLATQVTTIGAHLNAEDARFVSTNYNSAVHMPEAYVEIKLPDQSWSRIWSEMTRWNWLTGQYLPTNFYTKSQVNAALDQKADRAWGYYDSTTGEYAPDGFTWISSEKIAIAANLAYQRTVTTDGSVWVLESNGVVTQTGGLTNGFFRVSDDEGNALLEIVKGDKRIVGADASGVTIVPGFSPTKLNIVYSVVSDVHPTISVTTSLSSPNWKVETDAECVANVVWSGSSGNWVAQVQGKGPGSYPQLFVKATYQIGGETYISNQAPVSMQYIMLNGVKYSVGTATVSGHTVLTLTLAP